MTRVPIIHDPEWSRIRACFAFCLNAKEHNSKISRLHFSRFFFHFWNLNFFGVCEIDLKNLLVIYNLLYFRWFEELCCWYSRIWQVHVMIPKLELETLLDVLQKMTCRVFCRVIQWTSFYMIRTSVMKDLNNTRNLPITHIREGEIKKQCD